MHTIKIGLGDLFQRIIDPFKKGWQLLRQNPAFCHYLFLYFLGGAGIVLLHPVLPIYFKEHLDLSYQQLTLAFSFCKGLSFLASSPVWAKYMPYISLYRLNAYMNIFTSLFVIGLLAASFGIGWIYAGYICYGTMQGGCKLSWNLSGPIFSKENDSTTYSSLNLLLIGIRGCICPFLGYLLFSYCGALLTFMTTLCLCLIGTIYGIWLDAKYSVQNQPANVSPI